jgi:hypothetical protein
LKLAFTGNGTSGSWKIRGEQIGHALGATVCPKATRFDADLVVVVKRVPDALAAALRGKRWVWDIVDAYPQPLAAQWSKEEAVRWLRAQIARLNPTGIIWPNQRMCDDVGFDGPQAVIYHHHRPGIRINPVRKNVQVIGYEGAVAYLEGWRAHLDAECAKRGWKLVLNPEHLADVDIVLAMRGGRWDGYVPRHWKSNVKLANAHGSGTPFIGSPEAGYLERDSGAEYWARNLGELRTAFDWLSEQRTREYISDRFRDRAYPIDQAAKAYREFLSGV